MPWFRGPWARRCDGIASDGLGCGLYFPLARRPGGRGARPRALLAELEAVAAELVAPVLAFERPEELVLVDGGRSLALGYRRGCIFRRLGKLLLAARDFEIEAQPLPEELAQFAALHEKARAKAIADGLEQIESRLA